MEFSNINNRHEVNSLITSEILKISLNDVQNKLSESFIEMNDTISMLYTTIATNSNAILYGQGGFGKSEIVKAFCELYDIPVYTIVGYEGMEVEALLGIPDIQLLIKTSEYKIAFEKTVWVKPGILILEEFLDAKPSTAAALKDILSSGGFKTQQGFVESLISSVIICSNKTPKDVSINESLKAFYMDRFPFQKKIEWMSFSHENYFKLFKTCLDISKDNEVSLMRLAKICSASEDIISPRIALKAANVLIKLGWGSLNNIIGLKLDNLLEIQQQIAKEQKIRKELEYLNTIKAKILLSNKAVPSTLNETAIKYANIIKIKKELLHDYNNLEEPSSALHKELFLVIDDLDKEFQNKLLTFI